MAGVVFQIMFRECVGCFAGPDGGSSGDRAGLVVLRGLWWSCPPDRLANLGDIAMVDSAIFRRWRGFGLAAGAAPCAKVALSESVGRQHER